MKISHTIAALLFILGLAACQTQVNKEQDAAESKPLSMANPSAVYCDSLGGALDLDSGICTLPSGERIEHWDLYRRDRPQAQNQ
ncbi:DUF333 domain-containing protein [Shewanella rhizosphaerae]|uniref:putative hemolysin n=1 Tax=Shewanella rhizosphaerae TaxID=2864207 RepID=UPI001C654D33|nr:DUF333 domain-containing protein [Shewanella rhizosphaerae]QYK13051.1 DUF333 domain-containing protein [Shewanella rhizosphaerae]